jgi:hypothetical protein
MAGSFQIRARARCELDVTNIRMAQENIKNNGSNSNN